MLRTLSTDQLDRLPLRIVGIAIFTALTALSARAALEMGAVPFTLQVLVVLLSGMVLGARDGAASQWTYLGLIALNLPLDARGLGAAALFGPTGGYLLGFVPAAFVAGWLVEHAATLFDDKHHKASSGASWQVIAVRWLAGVAGIVVLYFFGATQLKLVANLTFAEAFAAGIAPFIALDLFKALLAAGLVETMRAVLLRFE